MFRRVPRSVVFCVVVGVAAPVSANGYWKRLLTREASEADSYREAAYRALEEQQASSASRAALEAVRRSPRSAEAHVLLGHARALAGDFARASDAYEHAISLSPTALDDVKDASWASRAASHAARWELAVLTLQVLTTRLPRIPARTVAFSRLGDALQALGPARLDEAIVAYRHALLDARGYLPSACIGLALALHRANRADEAHGWVERAMERTTIDELLETVVGPTSEHLARRALVARIQGNHAEASRLFRESASHSPHRDHSLREAGR
jgi:tetratricopeptide (TPR) repeat protein